MHLCNRYLGNAQIEVTLISKGLPLGTDGQHGADDVSACFDFAAMFFPLMLVEREKRCEMQ